MKNNKGSILLSGVMLFLGMIIIICFAGIAAYQQMSIGIMHNIKNDLYLVNRNVLLALERDFMGEDNYGFYEKEVKGLVEEEIKRLWNTDVSRDTERGIINRVDVVEAKIINEKSKMKIESILNIKLRPIIFKELLKDKLVFKTKETIKIKKMRSWEDAE